MYVAFGDIVEPNGKTIRENRMEIKHRIPLGAIVEFDFEDEQEKIWERGRARMYVFAHGRDCDGSPLYVLAMAHPNTDLVGDGESLNQKYMESIGLKDPWHIQRVQSIEYWARLRSGYTEEDLTVIETPCAPGESR